MYSKAFEFEINILEDFADQLETIEEDSQECTPSHELIRKQAKEWSKIFHNSFQSKSDELVNYCQNNDDINQHINNIKDSFHGINEELNIPNPLSKSLVGKVFTMKLQMQVLQANLAKCTAKISETEHENIELISKIKRLENDVHHDKDGSEIPESHKCCVM